MLSPVSSCTLIRMVPVQDDLQPRMLCSTQVEICKRLLSATSVDTFSKTFIALMKSAGRYLLPVEGIGSIVILQLVWSMMLAWRVATPLIRIKILSSNVA